MAEFVDPPNHREFIRLLLDMQEDLEEKLQAEIEKPDGQTALLALAAVGAIQTGVALAWVAREHGAAAADELMRLMRHYSDNGGDDARLFTPFLREEGGDHVG